MYPSWNTKWHIFIKTSRISYLIYLKCIFKYTFHLSWWHHKEKFSPYYIYMASWGLRKWADWQIPKVYPSWNILNNLPQNQQLKNSGLADPGLSQNQHLHQNSAHLDHFEKRHFNFCKIMNLVYPSWNGKNATLLRKKLPHM